MPDVLKEIFALHPIADVKFELTETYTPWTYCVQYNESDFDFVSRLMEHEGIFYFFTHEEGRHTLVIADSYSAHGKAYEEEIRYLPPEQRVRPEEEHVSSWSIARELRSGKYALSSYDFEKPSVDLQVKSTIPREHALADYEVFEYGGDYIERGDGEAYVRARIEEEQAKFERVQGATNGRAMAPGFLFTLSLHPRADQNAEYLIVSATYDIKSGEHEARDDAGSSYACTFAALNTKYPFRAERLTEKPIVKGPQTAVVVGPSGEDIYTDKFGRIKVHFYWDRYGKRDDQSSCWIRVSQNWGGKGWGGMFIPHVGQEVIVMFEGGDPDLPTDHGARVQRREHAASGAAGGKTQSIIRDHGNNHIRLEGKAGSEQINLFSPYAQTTFSLGAPNQGEGGYFTTAKDWMWNVGRNAKERIDGWRDTTVEQNYKLFVGGDTVNHFKGAVQFKYDGINIKLHGGLLSDKFLGIKQSTMIGATIDYYVAQKTTRALSWEFKRSAGKVITRGTAKQDTLVQDKVTIDSDSKTEVIGGGGSGNYCKLTLDGTIAKLKNGSAHATIKKDDKVTIHSPTTVVVVGKDTVVIDGKNETIINGRTVTARKGKFTTKNIKDLG